MTVVLIAAVADNGVIGSGNAMPWHLPEDLRHFKQLTSGHPMVMGRKTFDAIGRVLPGRQTVVVTRDPAWSVDGVLAAPDVASALRLARESTGDSVVMVAGGGEIFSQTIDLADRMEITHVHRVVEGDARFPPIDRGIWEAVRTEPRDGFTFRTYRRRQVSDLPGLLATIRPELQPGEYAFVTVDPDDGVPTGLTPVATVHEPEGTTLVVPLQQAQTCGLPVDFRCVWILLRVHSDLAAVGLTAAVATALADDHIACNIIAGFHHDHLFVPADRAGRALAALEALAHTRVAERSGT
jgi:dihydrofolate reductase